MVLWTLGGAALVLIIGAIALQYAIYRNGPAVLSAADRITGGSGGAELLATISTGDHAQQKLLVWGPQERDPEAGPRPVLVFVHGGSWRWGDPVDYGFVGRAFVPKGFVVVLAGYRLEQAGAFPAMLDDTARAIGWTKREIEQYGGDPDRIVIAGHSAGAYNVVMTAMDPQWLAKEQMQPSDIAGVIGLSGPYDFYPFDSDSTKAAFGGATDPEKTQPINWDASGTPQMMFVHGEKDDLVKPRNSRVLAEKLDAAGITPITIYPAEMNHNEPLMALAAPFRNRSSVFELVSGFALAVSDKGEVSVPVQDETR